LKLTPVIGSALKDDLIPALGFSRIVLCKCRERAYRDLAKEAQVTS